MRRFQRKLNKSVFVRLFCYYKAVYESLVRQIAGDELQADTGESLKQSVGRDEKKKLLEKQLNRQMEMNAELKRLKNLNRTLQ